MAESSGPYDKSRNTASEAAATIVAVGVAALSGWAVGGDVGILIVANVTVLAALFWILTSPRATKRLRIPYRLVRRSREIPPGAVESWIKGREARRTRRRRLRSRIREGTELMRECQRRVGEEPPAPGLLFTGLDQRVERWTRDVEKLLEGASERHSTQFHDACLVPVGPGATTDQERWASMMDTRLTVLRQIVDEMDQEVP